MCLGVDAIGVADGCFQRGLLEAGGVAVAQGWWAPERSESEPVSIREREREMMEPICDGLQTYLRPCY